MTIPTPSAIAKQATQRKQLELQQEAEREAQIKALEEKLDADSRSKSAKVRASRASHSSPKAKARGTSSPSAKSGSTKKTEHVSGKSTTSTSQSAPSRRMSEVTKDASGTPTIPQTGAKASVDKKESSTTSAVKKTFVRKPHLTQRLSDNEALLKLKESLPVSKLNRGVSSTKSGTSRNWRQPRTDQKVSSSQSSPRKKTQKPSTSAGTPSSSKQN